MISRNKTALLCPQEIFEYSFGDYHPFKIERFKLAMELLQSYSMVDCGRLTTSFPEVPFESLCKVHDRKYLERLIEFSASDEPRADFIYGLGDVENPVFKGMYEWSLVSTSATAEAARLLLEDGFYAAFNLAGGWHHAHKAKASGFSYINDAAVAISILRDAGKRVAYIDIDAHHGDGVQEAFYDDDKVLTLSIHESGIYFFPGTGFVEEIGTGRGEGFSVNIPLLAHSDDPLFMKAFDEAVYPLVAAFDPDIIVTQLGADTFRTDPLTNLEITTHSYAYILKKIRALKIPWLALGGGGYDIVNVARAWAIAWGTMNDITPSPKLPESFAARIKTLGYSNRMLLDAMHWAQEDERNIALDALEKNISYIREKVFPLIIR